LRLSKEKQIVIVAYPKACKKTWKASIFWKNKNHIRWPNYKALISIFKRGLLQKIREEESTVLACLKNELQGKVRIVQVEVMMSSRQNEGISTTPNK
jgi:hypothetical protein